MQIENKFDSVGIFMKTKKTLLKLSVLSLVFGLSIGLATHQNNRIEQGGNQNRRQHHPFIGILRR